MCVVGNYRSYRGVWAMSKVNINLVTKEEMAAHTEEMRKENDRRFVEALMVVGYTKSEALRGCRQWNAREGRY